MRSLMVVVLTLGCLSACTGTFITARDDLKMAVEEFNDGLRWRKVDGTVLHLPAERRRKFAERFAGLEEELEVMDYEIQRIDFDRQKDTAEVRVSMSWSLKRRGILERTILDEHWEHARGRWTMAGEKRLSGAPLPLFE